MKDLMKMMQQAQEIQGRMQKMQADMQALEVEGQSAGGMVKVVLNGRGDMRALRIDPALVKPGENEMIEDLVIAAFTDAKAKVETEMQAKMQEVTGGMALPPGMKLF